MTPTTVFGWQDVAALGVVLLAAVYLGRGFLARSTGKTVGCGPGACQGCPSHSGNPDGPGCSEPISIGGLPRPSDAPRPRNA